MDTLKELLRQARVILPELRKLTIAANKNQLTIDERNRLQQVEQLYRQTTSAIENEEQNVIRINFGPEILDEWNLLKNLKNTPYTIASANGKEI